MTDNRGFFKCVFQTSGIEGELLQSEPRERSIAQINHSWSGSNVLRGIHVEPWSKLVYVDAVRAKLVVDLRQGSTTYANRLLVDAGDSAEAQVPFTYPKVLAMVTILSNLLTI